MPAVVWEKLKLWESVCNANDPDSYRPNVGIVLMCRDGQLFWVRRIRRHGWLFVEGTMNSYETPIEAMYRELHEATRLLPSMCNCLVPRQIGYAIDCRVKLYAAISLRYVSAKS